MSTGQAGVVLLRVHGKPSNLHALLIHLKRRDSLEKTSARFCLLKIYKHIMPSQRQVSTWKATSQWKKRTPGVHIMQIRASQWSNSVTVTFLSHGQQRTKCKEKNILPQNKNRPRGKCCSMVSRRHLFRTMKNLTMKSNLGFVLGSWSLVTLLSSAFFAPSIFFFTDKMNWCQKRNHSYWV